MATLKSWFNTSTTNPTLSAIVQWQLHFVTVHRLHPQLEGPQSHFAHWKALPTRCMAPDALAMAEGVSDGGSGVGLLWASKSGVEARLDRSDMP